MRRCLWLILVLLVSCADDRVVAVAPSLVLDGRELVLPDAWVGFDSENSLTIRNDGRASGHAELIVTAPFSIDRRVLDVDPGSSVRVAVKFAPTQMGPAAGMLRIRGDGLDADVSLSGVGREPPTCEADSICSRGQFDGSGCTFEPANEGMPCEGGACLEEAACLNGLCVGTAVQCADDGNPCTRDLCDREQGCVHVASSDTCPAPGDPCKAAVCDPSGGCGEETVADGTPCGPGSCAFQWVCLQGSCSTMPTPDGTPCSPICGEDANCHGGSCVGANGGSCGEPVWIYEPPPDRRLHFPGLADTAGNLYWFECNDCICDETAPYCNTAALHELPIDAEYAPPHGSTGVNCELVSATRDGILRYRAPIDVIEITGTLIAGNRLVVGGWLSVAAYRLSDGEKLWQERFGGGSYFRVAGLVGVQPGTVIYRGTGSIPRAWMAGIAPGDGSKLWSADADDTIGGGAIDQDGVVYVRQDIELVALDPAGDRRWARQNWDGHRQYGAPSATAFGRVATGGLAVLDADTGAVLAPRPRDLPGALPLLGESLSVGITGYTPLDRHPSSSDGAPWQIDAVPFDIGFGVPFGRTTIFSARSGYPSLTSPFLLEGGGVLTAIGRSHGIAKGQPNQRDEWESWLVVVDRNGKVTQLPLPGPDMYEANAVLDRGRWIAATSGYGSLRYACPDRFRILAFDVGSAEPAARGWVTWGGNPQRSGVER